MPLKPFHDPLSSRLEPRLERPVVCHTSVRADWRPQPAGPAAVDSVQSQSCFWFRAFCRAYHLAAGGAVPLGRPATPPLRFLPRCAAPPRPLMPHPCSTNKLMACLFRGEGRGRGWGGAKTTPEHMYSSSVSPADTHLTYTAMNLAGSPGRGGVGAHLPGADLGVARRCRVSDDEEAPRACGASTAATPRPGSSAAVGGRRGRHPPPAGPRTRGNAIFLLRRRR